MSDEEYKKLLKQYHKLSDRHILVVETDMPYPDVLKVVALSDKIRKAGNELVSLMRKNYDQLMRTKKYRKLLKLYGNTEDKDKRKALADQLNDMQKSYNVTWDLCRTSMIPIGKKYSIDAVFALTKAEDIWRGMEKCLYDNGKTTHFSKYGELPCIRAKQINRGIPMFVEDGKLRFKLRKMQFGIQVNDRFQSDEVNAVLSYLENPDKMDADAVNTLIEEACCIDTYRPCYATLVPRLIRGKYRVYLHLTIEGKAKPKYDRSGNPRHKYGKGMIGADIGTQTVAYTSDTEVGLKNLSERGNSIQTSERKERLYYRAMDRSRRATNPQNYNPDGTIKKGKKTWKYSDRYKKLKAKHGLYFAKGKEQVKQHRLKEPDKSKYEIYTAVKNEIGKSRNWQQLQQRLAEMGIAIQFKYKGQTSEIQGISISKGEYTFKGSEIDRSFSFSKLDKCFGDAGMNVAESQRQTTFAPVREQAPAPSKADSPLITGSLGLFSASSPPVDEEPNFNLRKKKKKKKQLKL